MPGRLRLRIVPVPGSNPVSPVCQEYQRNDEARPLVDTSAGSIHLFLRIADGHVFRGEYLRYKPAVLPEDESEDFSASDLKEQPFDELVKNFYRKKFHVDIGEETFSLLMSIIEEN